MALLDAATKVFAEHGIAAPTSLISKTAGVSEGSLFTYFKTKEILINELYRELRLDLAAAVNSEFPRKGSVRARLEHVFMRYVTWGAQHPVSRRALRQASMSNLIEPDVRAESNVLFAEMDKLQVDAFKQRKLQQLPPSMASQALKAMADMTMDMIERHPKQADAIKRTGFQMLWAALHAKP